VNDFAKNLKALLKAKKLQQNELAIRLGIKPASVNQWTSGSSQPNPSRLAQIAEILGVTVNELVVGDKSAKSVESADDQSVAVPAGHTLVSTQSLLDSAQEKLEMQRKISELQAQVIAMKEKELQEKQQEIERQRSGRPDQDAAHTQP
jgi:transcriptional regulator with XRE-family HTH domain